MARRCRISAVRLFGSVGREDPGPTSDLDFLAEPSNEAALWDLAPFRREVEDLLGVDLDIMSVQALLPRDRDILAETVAL